MIAVEVKISQRREPERKAPRVYVSDDAKLVEQQLGPMPWVADASNEDQVAAQNVWRQKAIALHRQYALPQVSEAIADRLGCSADELSLSYSFSQKAGCSCGCSPGFVVRTGHGWEFDVWVTLREVSSECRLYDEVAEQELSEQVTFDCPADELLPDTHAMPGRTGRSPAGRLRNVGSMSDAKFARVYAAVSSEENDAEAMEALDRELVRRAQAQAAARMAA